MTRLTRRRQGAGAALYTCLCLMLAGSAAFALSPAWGGGLYGLSLAGLAAWLLCFDIARRTVAAHGLSRYMAGCLILGYAWLAEGQTSGFDPRTGAATMIAEKVLVGVVPLGAAQYVVYAVVG